MFRPGRLSLVLLVWLLAAPSSGGGTDPIKTDPPSHGTDGSLSPTAHGGPPCIPLDNFFADQVWAKVGEQTCLKCHHRSGDAADSALVLRDPAGDPERTAETLADNRAALARLAAVTEKEQSRLLLKVTGELDHGGGMVLPPDEAGYAILERFVRRVDGSEQPQGGDKPPTGDRDAPPFFAGVEMLSPQRLLRRVTLSLAGRLPSEQERAAVDEQGLEALAPTLDRVMQEDAFYERLVEGFNDVFLTLGYDGLPERVLSYDHFGKTRHWRQEQT